MWRVMTGQNDKIELYMQIPGLLNILLLLHLSFDNYNINIKLLILRQNFHLNN